MYLKNNKIIIPSDSRDKNCLMVKPSEVGDLMIPLFITPQLINQLETVSLNIMRTVNEAGNDVASGGYKGSPYNTG